MSVLHQSWGKPRPTVQALTQADLTNGHISLIDWEQQKVIWTRRHKSPSGVAFSSEKLYVASMLGQAISVFDRQMNCNAIWHHSLFADLHTIVSGPGRRLLLTSSGIDGILELDCCGRVTWDWLGTEHGFDQLMDRRRRVVDRRFDYSRPQPVTALQATHINSAIYYDDDRILATLFLQGIVVMIDRRTKRYDVVVSGLDQPHAIRPRMSGGGWTVCDTGANAVVLLDDQFRILDVVELDFDWVQDAIGLDDETTLVLDANNARIVELSYREGHAIINREFKYSSTWKAFGIQIVPRAEVPDRITLADLAKSPDFIPYAGSSEAAQTTVRDLRHSHSC